MKSNWMLIALLAGIFVAGLGTGTLVTLRVCRRPPPVVNRPPPSPETWSAKHIERMVKDVGVQPDQVEKIRPIVDKRMLEIYQLRDRFLDNNRAIRQEMEREVSELLTPEQRDRYERINREFHERARRQERGERPPPPPDRSAEK